MLVDGRYRAEEVARSLNDSPYFIVPSEEAPWKTVIQFDKHEDEVVKHALDRMEGQFSARSATNPGEMLHIFSLKMMMAENGFTPRTIDDTLQLCKLYIDDLRQ